MRIRLVLLVASIAFLAGCETVRYELRPPASDAGRLCVTHCAGVRESCRGNAIRRAKFERESCEHRAENTFRACLASAKNKDQRKECEEDKPSCWVSERTEPCEEEYRSCYQQCGGRVIKIIED